MRRGTFAILVVGMALPASAGAQGVHLGLSAGAVHPGSTLYDLGDAVGEGHLVKGNALGLGAMIEASFLRATLAYASGATIRERGVDNGGSIGEGTLLALAGDVVLRPIPRVVGIQPWLIGGLALKHEGYSWDDDGLADALPEDETEGALHIGIGADLMLGRIGITAEVSDFITRDDDQFGRHDSFFLLGLRIGLF